MMEGRLKSIQVIFQKCIEKEKLGELVRVLTKHFVISKGQKKKVNNDISEGKHGDALERIVQSIASKETWMITLEDATSDEEFPCNEKAIYLLKQLLESGFLVGNLTKLLISWDDIEKHQDDLRTLLQGCGIDEEPSDCWVLNLMHSAASQISKKETRIFELVTGYFEKKNAGNRGTDSNTPQLKRSIPASGDTAEDNESGNQAGETPEQKRKLSQCEEAQENAKKKRNDETNQETHQKTDKEEDPNNNDAAESTTSPGENVGQIDKKQNPFENYKKDEESDLSSNSSPESIVPTGDSTNGDESFSEQGQESDKKAQVTESSTGKDAMDKWSKPVFGTGLTEKSRDTAGSSKSNDNDDKTASGDRKVQNSTGKDARDKWSKPGLTQKNQDTAGACRSNTNEDKAGSGDDGESGRETYNTRSETKKKKNVAPEKPEILEPDSGSIEFRAILSKKSNVQNSGCFCIVVEYLNWKSLMMTYNEEFGYFYARLPCPTESCDIRYKFQWISLPSSNMDSEIQWERLPGDAWIVNRSVYYARGAASKVIVFNVCNFNYTHDWAEVCCNEMSRFLPMNLIETSESGSSSACEIFAWLNCVKYGWKTDHFYNGHHKPPERVFEQILDNWLKSLHEFVSNSMETKQYIKIILILVISMATEKHQVQRGELLRAIFNGLNMNTLSADDQQSLYGEVSELHEKFGQRLELSTVPESLAMLFSRVNDRPMVEWLYALPIYWLFMNNGEIKEKIRNRKKSAVLSRACLPVLKNMDWEKVWRVFHNNSLQKDILEASSEVLQISKLHPWIIGSYQYMLNSRQLQQLIKEREKTEIVHKFYADSAMSRILSIYGSGFSDPITTEGKEMIRAWLDETVNKALETNKETKPSLEDLQEQMSSIQSILSDITALLSRSKTSEVGRSTGSLLWCLKLACIVVHWAQELQVMDENCKTDNITDILDKLTTEITSRFHSRNVNKTNIQYWGDLLSIDWRMSPFQEKWKEQIIREIKSRLGKYGMDRNSKFDSYGFLQFYAVQLEDKLHDDVENCFSDRAYECAIELIDKEGWSQGRGIVQFIKKTVTSIVKGSTSSRLTDIFERLFQKEYQKTMQTMSKEKSPTYKSLFFICNWSFSSHFYQLFSKDEVMENFSSSTKNAIRKVAEDIGTITGLLNSKEIPVKHLKLILGNEKKFLHFQGTLDMVNSTPVDSEMKRNEKALRTCQEHLKVFQRTKGLVETFIDACGCLYERHIVIDLSDLDNRRKTDVSSYKVKDLVTESQDGVHSNDFFGLSAAELEEFSQISFIKDSLVFQTMFGDVTLDFMENSDDEPIGDGQWYVQWRTALECWIATKRGLMNLVTNLDDGEMSLAATIAQFKCLDGIKVKIECEIQLLYDFYEERKTSETAHPDGGEQAKTERRRSDPKLRRARKRIEQIYNLFQSEQSNDAISLLLKIRDTFQLEGSFKIIEERMKMMMDKETVMLKEVPQKLEIPEVCNLGPDKLHVLMEFMDKLEMINWLREKMKDISEVKVMCDLAMISAGESAMEVDKVSFLLSAVMGFAPLIFGLKKEEKDSSKEKTRIGLKELLEKCKEVWKNIDGNPGLLQKWDDTSKNLHWLKELENFHGSVEKLSLTRAGEINERGVYIIGKQPGGDGQMLEKSVNLKIPPKNNEDDCQELSLNDVQDLRSKLMLIAGDVEKGQRDVNQFIEVLASVQKLAEVYIKLVTAGCMLFSKWSAKVICENVASSGSANDLHIEVQFSENARPIRGTGTYTDVNKMTTIMENALERWNEYICKKRMEHYFLNEFSIQQILYLCHELAFCGVKRSVSDQVYTLLSSVTSRPELDDLLGILKEVTAMEDVEMKTDQEVDDHEDEADEKMEDSDSDSDAATGEVNISKEKRKAVITLVRSENVEETLAKAAVQALGCGDVADHINWTLEHEFDEDLVKEYSEKYDEENAFSHHEKEPEILIKPLKDYSRRTLDDMIKGLQDDLQADDEPEWLLDAIHTICTLYHNETMELTLQDYLSIEHFGRFLSNLRQDKGIQRELTPPMRNGQPNLLICTEHEILTTVLSLYMNDEKQPLPTSSEVLVCGEETTADEVERFMRRAMCECQSTDRLLFCLAFADKLSFNVSAATENIFSDLSKDQKIDERYQLVILLSNQQHYLNTCFDKYLVDGKWVKADPDIAAYLKRHLTVQDVKKSAACVDRGHSMVKVVSSNRSGVGKSLHIQRLSENLAAKMSATGYHRVTIRLLERKLNTDYVIDRLSRDDGNVCNTDAMLVHLDLTPAVQDGIENFVFNLFVLGSIQNSQGKTWKRHPQHLYAVELTDSGAQGKGRFSSRHILNLLPTVRCFGPRDILANYKRPQAEEWLEMDDAEFYSETFQRPFQYLSRYENGQDLDEFTFEEKADGNPRECMELLLRHCCMENPSWAQLRHFASFLNVQLKNCEDSVFCNVKIVGDCLRGLKAFAVKFMIRMSQDFATPSLNITDQSLRDHAGVGAGFKMHQLRRKWEESAHPYLFFNEDHHSISFINVNIDAEGHLLDKSGQIVERNLIDKRLVVSLKFQKVKLNENFDTLPRMEKLKVLCLVMGIPFETNQIPDPDPTYELTTDNVLKILAIYMRFRCQIPVIIMGETGCGKTRMVEFMSRLKASNGLAAPGDGNGQVPNMIPLKIHGGIIASDVYESVREAQRNAQRNQELYGLSTILFYDEANTTEAIYAIKEVMCDLTIDGESFHDSKLQIIAACNPYKQLSAEAIQKLEDSGLGYRIRTSETAHLFGNIPIRTLVYRVVALPPSMQPFIWDFGQLGDDAEVIYIQQMTKKLAAKLNLAPKTVQMINNVLSKSQSYMRSRKDECRYVSLRDVERCMAAFEWFSQHKKAIYPMIKREMKRQYDKRRKKASPIEDDVRTLLQTVGVCYHASLDERESYRKLLCNALEIPSIDEDCILEEFTAGQVVFLRNIKLDSNIACNEALRENVFMMAVCADMRIPLFLIGKPGSSKSLAKTIVMDNMQGRASTAVLYQELKQVHMLSYQCSALTDAAGIKSVFKQCARLQKEQELKTYTAVVILDEIGLAEDSANMPLKILHPLLECGSTDGAQPGLEPHKKVGFVGISNWALDPAKMNRGIFVTRTKPTESDLRKTAKGIFEDEKKVWKENEDLLDSLTEAYLEIYTEQTVEYFGLRDYYSLIKMFQKGCKENKDRKEEYVAQAIQRNFSGGKTSLYEIFQRKLGDRLPDATVPVQEMIRQNLQEKDSRFLLLLTHQFSVVSLLDLCIDNFESDVHVVFGSSFPGDHNYTEICRNINRIKACMETGKTVVLLNMTEIHESLYDALNQHYVTFGGQKYVDLGLGGHRVKCRIAEDFRLIVIEKKDVVYREYPIPLINRLEKHHFSSESLLMQRQKEQLEILSEWVNEFTEIRGKKFGHGDAFVGYHDDTTSSVVLMTGGELDVCKDALMQCCAMDSIFRLPESNLHWEVENVQATYLQQQCHDSLLLLLQSEIENPEHEIRVLEVVSYSNVLSQEDRKIIEHELKLETNSVMLLSLEQFQTEQEYGNKIDEFLKRCGKEDLIGTSALLLIQCSQAQSNGQLIACAKHCLMNKVREYTSSEDVPVRIKIVIAFLLSTERESRSSTKKDTLVLQHTRNTNIIYIDELKPSDNQIAPASNFHGKTLCDVLQMGQDEAMAQVEPSASLININSLLKDCVCEAVGRIKTKNGNRYLDHVRMLTDIFTRNDGMMVSFRQIMLEKMVAIYREREEAQTTKDWIVEQACSRESLQEGGTFRKTLWLCLRHRISRLLAYIISNVDKANNLDIICTEPTAPWKINIWLGIFKKLTLTWASMMSMQEFPITSPGSKVIISPQFPFSADVTEFLASHWELVEDQHPEKKQEVFLTSCRNSDMCRIIAGAPDGNKMQLMSAYASDIVASLHTQGTDEELEIKTVGKIVLGQSMKIYKKLREDGKLQKGDEVMIVFLGYNQISKYLQVLSRFFKAWPEILEKADRWVEEQDGSEEFVIHVEAAKFALELLHKKADKINKLKSCEEWRNQSAATKRVLTSLFDLVGGDEKRKIMVKWTPLSLLDLMMMELLPSSSQEADFQEHLSVISQHAKQLWKGSVHADVRGYPFLRIICNVLKKCYGDVRLSLLVESPRTECPICRKRFNEPSPLHCGHHACLACLRRLVTTSQNGGKCPICTESIPEDIELEPCSLSDSQTADLMKFRSSCTSFFLEYLDKFCFARPLIGTSPVKLSQMETQVKSLLRELVVQADDGERKELEPTALDLDINTRSYILRILLDHNLDLVFTEMNKWLKKLRSDQLPDLTMVIIHCFETRCYLRASLRGDRKQDSVKHWEKVLGNAWRKLLQDENSKISMALIQSVAEIRCALREFAHCSNGLFQRKKSASGDTRKQTEPFIDFVMKLATADDSTEALKNFIIKIGVHCFGTEWFHQVAEDDMFHALISPALLQATDEDKIDHWVLSGEEYADTKATLYKTAPAAVSDVITDILRNAAPVNHLQHVLSIFAWSQNRSAELKQMVLALLDQSLGQQSQLPKLLHQTEEVIMPVLQAQSSEQQAHVLYQLITVTAAVASTQAGMIGFHQLMTTPANCSRLFLPAMPESLYFATPADYRRQHDIIWNTYQVLDGRKENIAMYECPNGHPYGIGDCTRPYYVGKCSTCGAPIGGRGYNLVAGNKRLHLTEASQQGYLLKQKQKNSSDPADRMTKQGAAIVQFILHACLMVGLNNDAQGMLRLLGFTQTAEAQQYLVQNLQKNLQDLSDSLGRNWDDAVLILHKILHRIRLEGVQRQAPDWSTMENRRGWEQHFREQFLLPVFQNLDAVLQEAQAEVNDANNMSGVALYRLVHEVGAESDDEADDITWDHAMLWSMCDHPSSAHLLQYLADAPETATNGKVLQILLLTPDLQYVKHLKDVLQLQKEMIQKYQNEIDLNDAEETTFKQYLQEGGHSNVKLVDGYISLWNMVYDKLQVKSGGRLDNYFEPASLHSPIAMALPSTRGRGQCAKVLAEYLIDIHNDFLTACKQVAAAYFAGVTEVDVSQISPSQFVCIDKQHDLHPLIQMHTRYNVVTDDQGRHHHTSYNIDALEKQVREKFVIHKKLISKKSLPCIRYPQDVGVGADWSKVASNIQQQPLTAKIVQDVDRTVSHSHSSDVCEGVRTLTHAISFLAKVKKEDMYLYEFLEKELLLPATRTSMIPKCARIGHTLSLYQRLSWHKAVNFSQQGLNPYKDALSTVKQEDIAGPIIRKLEEAFRHTDISVLQQRLNEMLINAPDVLEEDWRLKDIFPEIPFIDDSNSDAWYTRLPDEICFKHISHLFSLTVLFMSEQKLHY